MSAAQAVLPVPIRAMSDAAKLLWVHLRQWAGRNGFCWWSQVKMAAALGWSERKLRYVLASLRRCGAVLVKLRGLGKTAIYTPLQVGETVGSCPPDIASPDRQTVCRSLPCSESKVERKAASSATERVSSSQAPDLPPAFIRNEYGREIPNPASQYLERVLRAARERIARAINPRAYENAIIAREMGKIDPARQAG